MTLHHSKKIVIIIERMIFKGVCAIIEKHGATGYTFMAAGGKGSRNMRTTSEAASVIDDFANIKIEIIISDINKAEAIMNDITETYFNYYLGITYLENVEILRPEKFKT